MIFLNDGGFLFLFETGKVWLCHCFYFCRQLSWQEQGVAIVPIRGLLLNLMLAMMGFFKMTVIQSFSHSSIVRHAKYDCLSA